MGLAWVCGVLHSVLPPPTTPFSPTLACIPHPRPADDNWRLEVVPKRAPGEDDKNFRSLPGSVTNADGAPRWHGGGAEAAAPGARGACLKARAGRAPMQTSAQLTAFALGTAAAGSNCYGHSHAPIVKGGSGGRRRALHAAPYTRPLHTPPPPWPAALRRHRWLCRPAACAGGGVYEPPEKKKKGTHKVSARQEH